MRKTTVCGLGAALLFAIPALASGTTQYTDRTSFESALGTIVLDDFEAEGYLHGDILDFTYLDQHSNAHMSGILGETEYFTTGFNSWNFIFGPEGGNKAYCAGCNGSFRLIFTSTSVGTASGVYGAGFDVLSNSPALPYHAFITFGDNTTLDVALPSGASFFGITSKLDIQSIHLGLAGGGFTTSGSFLMDNLTIGNIPAPGVLVLLGLAGFASRRRRRR